MLRCTAFCSAQQASGIWLLRPVHVEIVKYSKQYVGEITKDTRRKGQQAIIGT